jgi:hypothetical protein
MSTLDDTDPRTAVAQAFVDGNGPVAASVEWSGDRLVIKTSTASVAIALAGDHVQLTLHRSDDNLALGEERAPLDVGTILSSVSGMLASEAATERDHAHHQLGPDSSEAISAQEAAMLTGAD